MRRDPPCERPLAGRRKATPATVVFAACILLFGCGPDTLGAAASSATAAAAAAKQAKEQKAQVDAQIKAIEESQQKQVDGAIEKAERASQ
jgi:Sec-independent protein translocase protein TatA